MYCHREMPCEKRKRNVSEREGKEAVTNCFHNIGAGHVTWMCREFGNIWRYRNEGVEAYNKVLSKRANMFAPHAVEG
jgi:hypothetical protein